MARKWIKINDLFNGRSSVNKDITFKTPMLRLDLCDYSDVYVVVKGTIPVRGTDANNQTNNELAFKNKSPFTSYISKINNTFIDNVEDLDTVLPMHNFLEKRRFIIGPGSLRNYYRQVVNGDVDESGMLFIGKIMKR